MSVVRSARGESVDFQLLAIEQAQKDSSVNAERPATVDITTDTGERFLDKRLKRQMKGRRVNRAAAQEETTEDKTADEE